MSSAEHRARIAERRRQWRATPEGKEATRIQNQKRKEKIRAWHTEHKESRAAHRAHWAEKNITPERLVFYIHRRRAARLGGGGEGVTPEAWAEILECFDGRCAYCLEPATQRDHMVPLSRGGKDSPENVVPCCDTCNTTKHTKTPLEWLMRPSKSERKSGQRRML